MDRGELKSKGLFYNNQEFDAYVFVCGLIRQAKKRIVLVDRFVTEKTLSMMLKREKGVSVTIYTYDKSKVLEMDLATYNEQYPDSPMRVLPLLLYAGGVYAGRGLEGITEDSRRENKPRG